MTFFERYFAALDGPDPHSSLDLVAADVAFSIQWAAGDDRKSRQFTGGREELRGFIDAGDMNGWDFKGSGTTTLVKLDDVIQHCDAVVHVVGDLTGSFAGNAAVAEIRARYPNLTTRSSLRALGEAIEAGTPLSYTQWEAYLAIYHKKVLLIAALEPQAARDASFVDDHEQASLQRAHVERLEKLGHFVEIDSRTPTS